MPALGRQIAGSIYCYESVLKLFFNDPISIHEFLVVEVKFILLDILRHTKNSGRMYHQANK